MMTLKSAMMVPVLAVSLLATGCEDEEQSKRIKELEEELAGRVSEIESLNNELRTAGEERDKARTALDEAQRTANRAEGALMDAQREVEMLRKSEQQQRERARVVAAVRPGDEGRKKVQELLPAIWQIQGEGTDARGFVAQADGKTWLYLPARALGGGTKLVVKDAGGATVTQFGEFQISAEGDIARLEVKQEVAKPIPVDAKAPLDANQRLLFVGIPNAGASPKIEDSYAGNTTATEVEFNAYTMATSVGCPLFHTESGALIGMALPDAGSATLWSQPMPAGSTLPRAARLNREIVWKAGNIGAVLSERRKIAELNLQTRLMHAAAALSPTTSGLGIDNSAGDGMMTSRQVFDANKQLPVVQELFKLNDNLTAQKVRVSENDIRKQISSILGQIGAGGRRAATELRSAKPGPVNLKDAENALNWYQEAEKKLTETISALGR
jgi:hypothetical protein